VYQVEGSGQVIKRRGSGSTRRFSRPVVSRTVVLLGFTSLFADISAEMAATVLPLWVIYNLSLSPLGAASWMACASAPPRSLG
jgi:hypothetical protein